jgi:23S rRNA pseudouridine1911/1915/1917 synthase
MAAPRRHGHRRRLVHEQVVGVLVKDLERDALGEEGGLGARAEDGDELAGGEAEAAGEGGPAADPDASVGDEAEAALLEEPVEAHPVHLDAEGRPKIIEVRFVVEEDFHGYRLDHYLKRKLRRLSRTRIQRIIRTQLRGENGRTFKPHSPVLAGERLVILRPARPEPPAPRAFGVLYDDEDLLVVDKPAGLAMHATARYYFTTLTALLRERFPGQPLQICHRLDRETSGCVVVARGPVAAAWLKGAFEHRRVDKEYLAVARGQPDWDEREVDLPLKLADAAASRLRVRMIPAPDGLGAITRFRVALRGDGVCLLACRPLTGRQHQIRAHLAAIGHPIVGDKLYGHGDEAFARFCDRAGELSPEEVTREFGLARQALHASRITFVHPRTRRPLTIESQLPPDLSALLQSPHGQGKTRE